MNKTEAFIKESDVSLIAVVKQGKSEKRYSIEIDKSVKQSLREVMVSVLSNFYPLKEATLYEPSEKYGSKEKLYYPLDETGMHRISNIVNEGLLDECDNLLDHLDSIIFYYCKFIKNGKSIIAFKKSRQFKSIIRSKGVLIQWLDDSMTTFTGKVFQLDKDFDFFVVGKNCYITNPTSFEHTAQLNEEIMKHAKKKVSIIKKHVPFIDTDIIEDVVSQSPRAARTIAAIISRGDHIDLSEKKVIANAKAGNIQLEKVSGKLRPADSDRQNFINLINRRIYSQDFKNVAEKEVYLAKSRERLKK